MTALPSGSVPAGGKQDCRAGEEAGIVRMAAAKVNLSLQIIGKRPDGYHELESLVVFADFGDRLSFRPSATVSLQVAGPFAAALQDTKENLVLRAAGGLLAGAEFDGNPPGAAIRLEKGLPVAAGLGGGSADAAAAIDGLLALWKLPIVPEKLFELARSLGADVPVCLHGQASIMRGVGEVIDPAPELPDFSLLLVNPGLPLATPDVFRARQGAFSKVTDWPESFADLKSFVATLEGRPNDLEAAAISLQPSVREVLERLEALPNCGLARMSGSGASCFGLFPTLQEARHGAAALQVARPEWWVRAAACRRQ